MSSDLLSPLQLQIIQLCDDHEKRERPKYYYSRNITFEKYFIKYDSQRIMYAEYTMQQYISNLAEGDTSAPRVPKIYDYFTSDNMMGYLVMEYIQASATLAKDVPEKVANALQWLRGLPAPPDTTIGSVAGRDAPFMLFKGFGAPIAFSSIEAIERYMNKVRLCLSPFPNHSPPANHDFYQALNFSPKGFRPEDISFSNEKLVFTQTDMHEDNFFLDTEGKLCLIDFESVALLPESFGNCALASSDPFVKKVADCLNWSTHNLKSMGTAMGLLTMIGDETLGTFICARYKILPTICDRS